MYLVHICLVSTSLSLKCLKKCTAQFQLAPKGASLWTNDHFGFTSQAPQAPCKRKMFAPFLIGCSDTNFWSTRRSEKQTFGYFWDVFLHRFDENQSLHKSHRRCTHFPSNRAHHGRPFWIQSCHESWSKFDHCYTIIQIIGWVELII